MKLFYILNPLITIDGIEMRLFEWITRAPSEITFRLQKGFWSWEIWNLGNVTFGKWLLPRLRYYRYHTGGQPTFDPESYRPHVFDDIEWQKMLNRLDPRYPGFYAFTAEEWDKIICELIWWAEQLVADEILSNNDSERMNKCAILWAHYHCAIWN